MVILNLYLQPFTSPLVQEFGCVQARVEVEGLRLLVPVGVERTARRRLEALIAKLEVNVRVSRVHGQLACGRKVLASAVSECGEVSVVSE